ncbi:hypothetical protein B0H15DRAFT_952907 [Mycena belliarum]|uniref:DUF2828 domain-containing protein n=1 Tax=Mycena belliarum TaxID=1033014 RepID=A0AAD6U1U4_9AGAR|nr:hypothetical protein B0H15DRAFT_952907 [Mycena belliae]
MALARAPLRALHAPLLQIRHSSVISRTRSSQNPVIPAIPELFNPNFLDELIPPAKAPVQRQIKAPRNPMMDALCESSHRTTTENGAPAYNSTLSATLDAFQKLTPYSYGDSVGRLLERSWMEDPDLTLRIIWNLRSIHDGKGEREVFYRAFGWLYDNHPRTAITNLRLLTEPVGVKPKREVGLSHGYYKDLLNILALATVGELSNISKPATFLHNYPIKIHAKRAADPTREEEHDPKPNIKLDIDQLKSIVAFCDLSLNQYNC